MSTKTEILPQNVGLNVRNNGVTSRHNTTPLPPRSGNSSIRMLLSKPQHSMSLNRADFVRNRTNSPSIYNTSSPIRINKLSFGSTNEKDHSKDHASTDSCLTRKNGDQEEIEPDSTPDTPSSVSSVSSMRSGYSHLGSRPRKTDSFQLRTLVKQSLDSKTCTPKPIKTSKKSDKSNGIISENNTVAGTYGNDVNITEIHRIVVNRINENNEKKKIDLKQLLDKEIVNIKKPQNVINRRNSISKIKKYRSELDEIESSLELNKYLEESKELLDNYMEIGVKLELVSFGKGKMESGTGHMSEEQEYRIMIIERYLEIARKYTDINIFKKHQNYCTVCKNDISLSTINDIGMLVCSICGTESVTLAKSISPDEESSSNNATLGNLKDYEDRGNFQKAMVRYQGKQPNKFPEHLYDLLDKYFESVDFPVGKEISVLPLNDNPNTSIKTRGKSNKSLMLKALKDIGMSSFYEDINLLCHTYWGWVLPNLSEIEDAIMTDYDLSQEVFERLKGDRKSCLNIQYRLWRHLSRRGHPCNPNDFKIIKTPEIVKYYERMWENICDELGWDKPVSLL